MNGLGQIIRVERCMIWLDLGVVCLLLWGAVAGYLNGWKQTAGSLVVLLATTALAVAFQEDMKAVLVRHAALNETIKAAVNSRLFLPVGGEALSCAAVLNRLGYPSILSAPILKEFSSPAAVDFRLLADLLAQVALNAVAFGTVLLLWWSGVYLVVGVLTRPKTADPPRPWLGAAAGAVRQYLLIMLVCGALTPLLWLLGLPATLDHLEGATLVRWGLQLFNHFGVWWR